jgi:predicted nuclease of predicted toxin-antitoxin system
MKILLDANLSWRLVKQLLPIFPHILHVERTGLPIPAEDVDIWNWAKANDYMIVTNDEDFFNLLVQKGFPPKIVMLRMGNQSTKSVASVLHSRFAEIQILNESDQYGVLELF